jgi:hypothetical protein
MCLLCRYHHREFERRGWQIRITDGVPEFIPPAWIDPERKPMRNRAHHPRDLEFSAQSAPDSSGNAAGLCCGGAER